MLSISLIIDILHVSNSPIYTVYLGQDKLRITSLNNDQFNKIFNQILNDIIKIY